MKTRTYLVTGLLAYILFLVGSAPATNLYRLNDSAAQIRLEGISGSLWNGQAQRATIATRHIIDDLDWSFCAWRLLTGEICLNLDATYHDRPVRGQLGVGLGNSIKARNLTADADAQLLGKLLGLPIGELSGLISADLSSASWRHGSAPRADGTLRWNNAAVKVAETASLGTIDIVLSESDEYPLTASINNKGGQIALKGHAYVSDDGVYSIELNLNPNKQASRNIRSSLEMFAKKQANGSFVLKNSGNLEQYGLM